MEPRDDLAYYLLNGMEPAERAHFVDIIRTARQKEAPDQIDLDADLASHPKWHQAPAILVPLIVADTDASAASC